MRKALPGVGTSTQAGYLRDERTGSVGLVAAPGRSYCAAPWLAYLVLAEVVHTLGDASALVTHRECRTLRCSRRAATPCRCSAGSATTHRRSRSTTPSAPRL